MNNSLIITTPQAMSNPPAGTPVLRVPGDILVATSDTFSGVNATTLAGRSTDAALGGKPIPYQFLQAASYGISSGRLVPGSSSSVSVALVEVPAHPADLTVSTKITALPPADVTTYPAFLALRRSTLASAQSQIRVGFSGQNMSLFVFLGDGKEVYVSGSVTPVAVGDTVAVREYRGLVQLFKNGTLIKEAQYPTGTFIGDLAGYTTSASAVFGFDDFKVTETLH